MRLGPKHYTGNISEERRLEICNMACNIAQQIRNRVELGEHRIQQQTVDVPAGLRLADMACEGVFCKLMETHPYSKRREKDELSTNDQIGIKVSVLLILRTRINSTQYQLLVTMDFVNDKFVQSPRSVRWQEITSQERGSAKLDSVGNIVTINYTYGVPIPAC